MPSAIIWLKYRVIIALFWLKSKYNRYVPVLIFHIFLDASLVMGVEQILL
jgi:hypothetical protein